MLAVVGGAPALLIGTWKLSPEAGAIAIGPEPGSTEWYAAPAGWQNGSVDSNIDFQTDDRWTFTPEGEFIYDNNGSTMNPFDGYIETQMTVEPTAYVLEAGAGLNGNDVFTVDNMNTEVAEICGWMGVWDSGPTYTIVELTPSRLVLHALQQNFDCTNPTFSGYFTLIFERVSELYSNCYTEGCTDAVAVNFDPWRTWMTALVITIVHPTSSCSRRICFSVSTWRDGPTTKRWRFTTPPWST